MIPCILAGVVYFSFESLAHIWADQLLPRASDKQTLELVPLHVRHVSADHDS